MYDNPEALEFKNIDNSSDNGDNIYQSPIWVREESLKQDSIAHYTQIVGHTKQPHIKILDQFIFIDTLSTSKEYLCIENQTVYIKSL